MDGLVKNCVFLEDPVYGWFGGELCIPGGAGAWIVVGGTVCSWRTQCMNGLVGNCEFLADRMSFNAYVERHSLVGETFLIRGLTSHNFA